MKGFKIFLVVLAGLFVLAALVVMLALTPAVQTWAARRALAAQAGASGHIGRIDAGFSRAELTDVHLVTDGMVIGARKITARYSAWDYLTRNRLEIDEVNISDLDLDLRNRQPSTVASDPSPAASSAGLLGQVELPLDVRIAKLTTQGRALLSDTQSATFELTGADIQSGQRGTLQWTAEFTDTTVGTPVRSVRSSGRAIVHISESRRLEAVEIEASARAEGPQIPKDQLSLIASAAQLQAGGDETFDVRLGIERNGKLEPLLASTARFGITTKEFAGSWNLTVRPEQLADVLAGFGLPSLGANGAGKFTFNLERSAMKANGDLQANLSQLEKLSPHLASIGSVRLRTTFDGELEGTVTRLERFQLDAVTADGRELAQINTLQPIGFDLATKRASFENAKAELARINIRALPLAWAQPFVQDITIQSGDLSVAMAVEAEPDGSRIRTRTLEPLTLSSVTLRRGEQELVNQLTARSVHHLDYSATRIWTELSDLDITMPAGDALSGRLAAEVTNLSATPTVAFTSQLHGKIVGALRAHLPADIGPLMLESRSDGRLEGGVLHLAKATTTISRDGGAMLAMVELQQPLVVNLEQTTVSAANPNAVAARLQLGEVPLAWGESFVKDARLTGVISGGTFEASLPSAEEMTLTTTAPLRLHRASAALEGKPTVQNLDVMADFTATRRGELIDYELRRLELHEGEALLATLGVAGTATGKGDTFALQAKGNLSADIAALMRQPAAAGFATLNRGRLTTAFETDIGAATQIKAAIAARNLVARENNQILGDLELTLDTVIKPDGTGTVKLPLTLANANRRSDVAVDGSFGKSRDGKSFLFTGKIASSQLFVDDFTPLAAIAPGGEQTTAGPRPSTSPTTAGTGTPRPPPAPAPRAAPSPRPTPSSQAAAPQRDTEPFWGMAQGRVQMDLARVVYGKDYVISGIRGGATITPSRVSLEGLEGRLNENPFKSNAVLTFNQQQAKPYALTGSADVNNFDIGALLRAANPNERPAMESKLNVVARLQGNGATVGDLVKNVYGQFDLTGSQGVLRALGRRTETASTASALLGIAGILTESRTTSAIAEVTAAFSELRFDNFRMQIERDADLSFKLSNIEFVSPLMRTTGTGRIASRGDAPVQNQPMEIQLQFGAKDHLAQLLTRVGALGQNVDDRGYRLLQRSFTLGGTPAKPDSGSLWTFLLREAAAAGVPALQDLLNRRE